MTAEGWDGKSVADHVEDAKNLANDAYYLAQGNEEKLDELISEVGLVRGDNADILESLDRLARRLRLDPKSAPPEQAAAIAEAERTNEPVHKIVPGGHFPKVKRINSEIWAWRHFLAEMLCVRAALKEWRALDEGTERRHD